MSLMEQSVAPAALEERLEEHRSELTGYCYRMLGSPFEAEDAVQDTFLRAWRGFDRFEGRVGAALVALPDRHQRLPRHAERPLAARPADGSRARRGDARSRANLNALPEVTWIEPIPRACQHRGRPGRGRRGHARHDPPRVRRRTPASAGAPARRADSVRGDCAGRPARSRSCSRRASPRSTARSSGPGRRSTSETSRPPTRSQPHGRPSSGSCWPATSTRSSATTSMRSPRLIREDASQSMPPYDLWLSGRDDIFAWWLRPGHRLPRLAADPGRDRERVASRSASTSQASRAAATTRGRSRCSRFADGQIVEFTFFLSTERLFPLFGLPPRLDA